MEENADMHAMPVAAVATQYRKDISEIMSVQKPSSNCNTDIEYFSSHICKQSSGVFGF